MLTCLPLKTHTTFPSESSLFALDCESLEMGSRQVMLVVALACVALTVAEGAVVPESVLRLFGVESGVKSSGEACGPQVDIETPKCQVVETRSKYELRKYTDSEVSISFRSHISNSLNHN